MQKITTNKETGKPVTVFAYQQSTEKEKISKLYIYDDITKYGKFNWETWSYEDSETSAKRIKEILESIPEGNELEIHINSNGGEVYEAVTIYQLLCQKQCRKVSYVDGVAHSAAFIIPFACDWRIMGLGTAALFHNMWTYTSGNAKELRQEADRLDSLMRSNRQIYLQRAQNITEEEMIQMMEAETILTPEQCLEYGFCDEITGYMSDAERQEQNILNQTARMEKIRQAHDGYRQQFLAFQSQTAETLLKDQGTDQKEEPPTAPVLQKEQQTDEPPAAGQPKEPLNSTKQEALKIASAFLMAINKSKED